MNGYTLAIDAGTGAGRCMIVDEAGTEVSSAYREWSYNAPEEIRPLGLEFDPQSFWGIICHLIRESIDRAKISRDEIKSVSATSQGQGAVFLDKNGKEVYAGPNMDIRGLLVQDIIEDSIGEELFEITGHAPYLIFIPARLLWFRENKRDVFERIAHALSLSDWITYKLSGKFITEPSTASNYLLFDVRKKRWSKKILSSLELSEELLPEVSSSGEPVGNIISPKCGLSGRTVVTVGGPDVECGLLGSGVTDAGQAGAILGTTAPIRLILSDPYIDKQRRIWSTCHIINGRWALESNAQMAGMVYRWLRDKIANLMRDSGVTYNDMDEKARFKPVGSNNTYSFLGPEIMDLRKIHLIRQGMFIFPPPTNPVVEPVDLGNLIRSTLENISYAIRGNIEQLAEISRKKIRELAVCGGLAKSGVFLQILADVLNITLNVPRIRDASSLGCSICASVGAGFYKNLTEGSSMMVSFDEDIIPDKKDSEDYEEHYKKWRVLYEKLPDFV